MTVTKINGFRAPYRSQTFQQQVGAELSRSGVMTMEGVITDNGTSITVPPFTFAQDGLIVKKTTSTTVSVPALEAPYYLTVYSPAPTNTDNLIFTFASTPLEFGGSVVVAAWDGFEWRMPQMLSLDEVYKDIDSSNRDFGLIGPISGLATTLNGSDWNVAPGVIVDKTGLRQELKEVASYPVVQSDPDFNRIDRILYRRAKDHPGRVGHRDFLLGSTFSDTGPTKLDISEIFDATKVRSNIKVVTTSDNVAHIFCASGYGTSYQLTYAKVETDRTTISIAATDVTPMSDSHFDVKADEDDKIQVVYTLGQAIKWIKLTSSGVIDIAPVSVSAQSAACSKPRLSLVPDQRRSFITYQCLLGAGNSQIFFASMQYGGTVATTSKNLTNALTNLVNPDIYVTDDLIVHIVWEDSYLKRCYLQRFDDVGTAFDLTPTAVSTSTVRTNYANLVDGAKEPRVVVSDNKEVFVLFLQDKGIGSGVYGLSIWNSGAAFQPALISSSEALTGFDFDLDPIFNSFGLLVSQSSRLDYVRLRGDEVKFTLPMLSSGVSSLSLVKDRWGSLLNVWTSAAASTFTSLEDDIDVAHIGPATVTGGLNNAQLDGDQLMIATGGEVPKVGDKIIVTMAGILNDGERIIKEVLLHSLNADNDYYLVRTVVAFGGTQSPATGAKLEILTPDGNAGSCVKSTPENQAGAYSLKDLDTDTLLARLLEPSQTILNYNSADADPKRFEFFLVHGEDVTVDWSNTEEGSLTITGQLQVQNLITGDNYLPESGSYPMNEGDALYVFFDGENLTPDVLTAQVIDLPWNLPIQVLGVVKEGRFVPHLLGLGGITVLDEGEASVVGQDLSTTQKLRLGITSDTTYAPYTSTEFIAANDSYPQALSKIDEQLDAIASNLPIEEEFFGDGVTTTFQVTGFNFNADNSIYDLIVFQDGRKQGQDPTGGTNKAYRKVSTTQIQFTQAPRDGVRVTIRKEGTSYGGAYEPTAGKLWSDPVDANITPPDLAFNLGAATNRFQFGYVDTLHVNQLVYNNAAANLSDSKTKTNGGTRQISSGEVVSLYTDGKIYPVDPDNATSSMLIGIALDTIPVLGTGRVALFGKNLPGVLAGLGLTSGFEIYISTTGQFVDSSVAFTSESVIAKIGWSDCADNQTGGVATDLIMHYEKITLPTP